MVVGTRRRVMLVDDDDSMRRALQRLLETCDFDCIAFACAEDLLAYGIGEGAACVVCDLMLPEMSGLDLLEVLRVQGGWPPLILISANDRPGLADEATRRGAAAYLAKPFARAALLAAIQAAAGPVVS
jgi:two-component system response regulator FixJ